MATRTVRPEPPLIVIVGPTASGKTGLAVELAKQCHGEIICADSRTIYQDMNIGTAKPTEEEQAAVPHWGLDLVEPGERFTAADFKSYALEKISEIRQRGHVPFLVGGTGLYIDGVVLDYHFGGEVDAELRKKLMGKSEEELIEYCIKNNIELPENVHNKRYIIRSIEQNGINRQRRNSIIENCIVVGISTENEELRKRIVDRTEQLFLNGIVDEAKLLGKKYGWDGEAMTANIYPLLHDYIQGKLTLEDVKQAFITADWKLAKRQRTWLMRHDFIRWLSLNDADAYLKRYLAIE